MKSKVLILFVSFLFLLSCSSLKLRSKSSEEVTPDSASVELTSLTEEKKPILDDDQSTITEAAQNITGSEGSHKPVAVPSATTSEDQNYVINELTFEIKKLSAEVKHLKKELREIQSKSKMWTNPLAMYDKEIVTKNGTTVFGKVVFQDENIVKVETLIGYLTLEKESIVRIITNVPEKPAEQYVPDDITVDLEDTPSITKMIQQQYISGGQNPADIKTQKTPNANCVLLGNIKEVKDRTGNTIFTGEVKNIGSKRADFVKVNFVFRKNWSGDTKNKTSFIEGSYFTFERSGITTNNSLLPGATGKFKLIIPKSFGSFVGYSYTVEWEQYK